MPTALQRRELALRLSLKASIQGLAGPLLYQGGCMNPWLKEGDLCYLANVELQTLRCGDIVVFRQQEQVKIHRLIRVRAGSNGAFSILTKADRYCDADPPIGGDAVMGKVVCVKRRKHVLLRDTAVSRFSARVLGRHSLLEAMLFRFLKKHTIMIVGEGRLSPSLNRLMKTVLSAPMKGLSSVLSKIR